MCSIFLIFALFSCCYCAEDYYSKEQNTKEYWRPTTESYWEKIKVTTPKDVDKQLLIQTTYAKPYYATGLYTFPYYVFGEFANVYRPPFGYSDVNYFNYYMKKQNKDKQYVPSYKA